MSDTAPYQPSRTEREQGLALVLSLLFMIVAIGVVTSGSILIRSHRAKTATNFARFAQAAQLAESGLTEAVGWFGKQTTQPVLAFDPQLDPTASPPVLDTDDDEIGIVREFQISGPVWARWEVWKEWPGDPDPERLAWRQKMQASDVSSQQQRAAGSAWQVRSIGYVFHRRDPSLPFDQKPNYVVAQRCRCGACRSRHPASRRSTSGAART